MSQEHTKPLRGIAYLLSEGIDPRIIYLVVALALAMPLIWEVKLPPAPMAAADAFFEQVEKLQRADDKLVVIALDWGPGTKAENQPQSMVAMEHLLRKRIPFAVVSIYAQAAPLLDSVPKDVVEILQREQPAEKWEYGKDWVNWGYQPNGFLYIQNIAKAADLHPVLKTDAYGTPIGEIPLMARVHTLKDVQMLMQFTGLVGVFNWWLQFFYTEGYRPPMVHGCTSITIPDAYIYYASKQIVGFYEGVAGAAWYDKLLTGKYAGRKEELAVRVNTGLAFAQLIVLGFIILGNIGYLMNRFTRARPDA